MNPEMQDVLNKKAAQAAQKLSQEQHQDQSQLAHMIANSTLMRSYEAIMQQYEQELEKKTTEIANMQAEQQQVAQENTDLSHQLYTLKTKLTNSDGIASADEEKIDRIQKDQMV
jgi:hypothetical protein